MTIELITSEFQLEQLCKQYAKDIISDAKNGGGDWLSDLQENHEIMAFHWADGSQHVIYTQKALSICTHCNTDRGESWVEDTGHPYTNIGQLASAIVYGEIYSRTMEHLQNALDVLAEHDDLVEA
jgi:hypothetical protein